jgi:hypothetical protein
MNYAKYTAGWWAERLPIIAAYANGETVLVSGQLPGPGMSFGADISNYTIAPKTITVNGFDVPAPETVAPDYGTKYCVPALCTDDLVDGGVEWNGDKHDGLYLQRGIVYLNKDHAIARAKAMLGIDPAEDCK